MVLLQSTDVRAGIRFLWVWGFVVIRLRNVTFVCFPDFFDPVKWGSTIVKAYDKS